MGRFIAAVVLLLAVAAGVQAQSRAEDLEKGLARPDRCRARRTA